MLVQFFCVGPKIDLQRPKDDLRSVKLFFCGGTKVFEEALNAIKFMDWLKTFGPAQNILGPVKGQGIECTCKSYLTLLKAF